MQRITGNGFDCSSVYLVSPEVRQVRSAVPETTNLNHVIYVPLDGIALVGRGFYFEDRLEDFGRRGSFRGPSGILKTEIGMRKATDSRESWNLGRLYWKAAKACGRINLKRPSWELKRLCWKAAKARGSIILKRPLIGNTRDSWGWKASR